MELVVVLSTFPNLETAREIARALVEARLAACVNLCPGVESIYRWEGKMESSAEVLALIKTNAAVYDGLERELKRRHPYETPEIVALPAERASAEFATWVGESVTPGGA